MLEQTNRELNSLPPDLWKVIEAMAAATLRAELVQDLLSSAEANKVVEGHRAENTEEWRRALAGSLSALEALHRLGYDLAKPDAPALSC